MDEGRDEKSKGTNEERRAGGADQQASEDKH